MAVSNKYFLFVPKHKHKIASAFAPEGTKLAHELMPEIKYTDKLPFELTLVRLSEGKAGLDKSKDLSDLEEVWLDYQPNSLAWPLVSSKLKAVIDNNITGQEGINWVKAKVNAAHEQKIYYVLRFEKLLDVLDIQKTIFVPGTDHIIKPCFSLSKISKYNVFHKPSSDDLWQITSGIYISESLKKAIQKEKVTGVDFEKVSTA